MSGQDWLRGDCTEGNALALHSGVPWASSGVTSVYRAASTSYIQPGMVQLLPTHPLNPSRQDLLNKNLFLKRFELASTGVSMLAFINAQYHLTVLPSTMYSLFSQESFWALRVYSPRSSFKWLHRLQQDAEFTGHFWALKSTQSSTLGVNTIVKWL